MAKKTKSDYIIDLINKIDRSVRDLDNRTKFDIYSPSGLIDEVNKHKELIYKLYTGRRDD